MKANILGPNVVELVDGESRKLQSYDTVVVHQVIGVVVLDPRWDCSRTTVKHVTQYLRTNPKDIRNCIKTGHYSVHNLNLQGHQSCNQK